MPPQGQKPPPKKDAGGSAPGDRATEVIFLVFVLVAIFAAAANFINSREFRGIFVRIFPSASLSYYDTATGARIYISASEGNVRAGPGGLRIGAQPNGAVGVITEGPEIAEGGRFWNVDFQTGPDGWLVESELKLFKPQTIYTRILGGGIVLLKIIAAVTSLLFVAGIVYALIRTSQIASEQGKREKAKENANYIAASAVSHENRRWEKVLAHIESDSPPDWRLAVLEADIMLSEMLERMGYLGENVGEKLKRIEKADFNSIDDVWEAHKIRNLIAHHGSDYVLSKREAQRVISLYANAFREFRYI